MSARDEAVREAGMEARSLREAVHWSGPKCWPENCPGVDECCYAEDDGTGPDSTDRWISALNALIADGWHPPGTSR